MSKEPLKQPTAEPKAEERVRHPDDVIVVPKGSSKARFLLTFLLVIMLLTTFSVSQEVVACFSGRGAGAQGYMSWKHPSEGPKSMSGQDFLLAKRVLSKIVQLMYSSDIAKERDDEIMANVIIMSDLAEDAGIHVTDKELSKTILDRFKSPDVYHQALGNYDITTTDFEGMLRRYLEGQRYQLLLTSGFATADPAEVEKTWKGQHQEHAFDYIEISTLTLNDEARGLVPGADELKVWFDALPENDKSGYKTKKMASAEYSSFPLDDGRSAEALFKKYPRPEGEDLDKLAETFYGSFELVLFRNPDFKPGPDTSDFFLPFEKVKDKARRDAPIYNSMLAWHADMLARITKGETVDLAAEAVDLGLPYKNQTDPLNQESWAKRDVTGGGQYLGEAVIMDGVAQKLTGSVVVDTNALHVVRVKDVIDERTPDFPEIQERVRDAWVKKKVGELAVKKLEALRDKLGTRPDPADANAPPFRPEVDAEKFAAAAKEAGYEVKHRDYRERSAPLDADASPADRFLQQAGFLYTLKVDAVGEAQPNRDASSAFLVRVAGIRDADLSKMTAADVQNLGAQSSSKQRQDFFLRTFSSKDFLRDRYALRLESWERQKDKKVN